MTHDHSWLTLSNFFPPPHPPPGPAPLQCSWPGLTVPACAGPPGSRISSPLASCLPLALSSWWASSKFAEVSAPDTLHYGSVTHRESECRWGVSSLLQESYLPVGSSCNTNLAHLILTISWLMCRIWLAINVVCAKTYKHEALQEQGWRPLN